MRAIKLYAAIDLLEGEVVRVNTQTGEVAGRA